MSVWNLLTKGLVKGSKILDSVLMLPTANVVKVKTRNDIPEATYSRHDPGFITEQFLHRDQKVKCQHLG